MFIWRWRKVCKTGFMGQIYQSPKNRDLDRQKCLNKYLQLTENFCVNSPVWSSYIENS